MRLKKRALHELLYRKYIAMLKSWTKRLFKQNYTNYTNLDTKMYLETLCTVENRCTLNP